MSSFLATSGIAAVNEKSYSRRDSSKTIQKGIAAVCEVICPGKCDILEQYKSIISMLLTILSIDKTGFVLKDTNTEAEKWTPTLLNLSIL